MNNSAKVQAPSLARVMSKTARVFIMIGFLAHVLLFVSAIRLNRQGFVTSPRHSANSSIDYFFIAAWLVEALACVGWLVDLSFASAEVSGDRPPFTTPQILQGLLPGGVAPPGRVVHVASHQTPGRAAPGFSSGLAGGVGIGARRWVLMVATGVAVTLVALTPSFNASVFLFLVLDGGCLSVELLTAFLITDIAKRREELRAARAVRGLLGPLATQAPRWPVLSALRARDSSGRSRPAGRSPGDAEVSGLWPAGIDSPVRRARSGASRLAFDREGRLLELLQHPQIPRFVSSFTEGTGGAVRLDIAHELVQGRSLQELAAAGPMEEAEVITILGSLLDVLSFLHAQTPKVIHRGIKPTNIIRRDNGSLVLIDFGAARQIDRTMMDSTLVGTFGYMPAQ
jgi:hypothetical protein